MGYCVSSSARRPGSQRQVPASPPGSGGSKIEFPKEKMEFVTSHGGVASEEGWLVLHIGSMDLDGISKIYIDLAEVQEIKQRGERHSSVLEQMRSLLGGD